MYNIYKKELSEKQPELKKDLGVDGHWLIKNYPRPSERKPKRSARRIAYNYFAENKIIKPRSSCRNY
jgi:hypothetical protein